MRNVYDIKIQEKLNIVLMKKDVISDLHHKDWLRIGVFIHLHYIETLDYYVKYMNCIPPYIDIYISYSDNKIKDKLAGMLDRKDKIIFIKKKNRGRDISAFLVAFRNHMLKYQYICFMHDKKEKTAESKLATEEWIYSMWENMLASEEYIGNIIWKLETDSKLGLLVPPGIITERTNFAIENIWAASYKNTKMLAEKLSLCCDIDENKTPITQGTCFWAKAGAIKKLIDYDWKYEDFLDEPLPDDNTINHAVERVLAYAAQDAGFLTGWVMTDEFANDYIVKLLNAYAGCLQLLQNELGIGDLHGIEHRRPLWEKLKSFVSESDKIFIYGSGKRAKWTYMMLVQTGIMLEAFVVSHRTEGQEFFLGVKVVQFDKLDLSDEMGFIVGVGSGLKDEIVDILHKRNIEDKKILILE